MQDDQPTKSTNIVRVDHKVSPLDRWRLNGHTGGIMWFTGLSASGKSTLAVRLEERLHRKGMQAYVLDGDNLRHGLNADLGFSPEDRTENIRRVGETALLMAEAGFVVISAFISPYRADRDRIRERSKGNFHEIFVSAPISVCEARDPKGLYKKARAGMITDFTGISAPYEEPLDPEMIIDTASTDVEGCVDQLVEFALVQFALESFDSEPDPADLYREPGSD